MTLGIIIFRGLTRVMPKIAMLKPQVHIVGNWICTSVVVRSGAAM